MKHFFLLLFLPAALAAIEEKETTQQTYASAGRLEIRNINGSVRVTGASRSDFHVTVHKRIEAKNSAALEQAKREVRLDAESSAARLRLCVAGPWSDCSDSNQRSGCRGDCSRDYSVRYEIEVEAPQAAAADLKTVNGSVTARHLSGTVSARTVNGAVTLEEVGAAGLAHTVNGAVKISMLQSPSQPLDAKTINGTIDVAFPKNLNAQLRFKTLHGDVFTSFPATAMAAQPVKQETKDGKSVFRADRSFAVQVGAGGIEHRFETLNGNIEIRER
ncbi:MAG: hypothetical protein JNK48_27450 [Bryobacterales bacterium]|nr:hypothetical protein [Bryobacterales bacterium]